MKNVLYKAFPASLLSMLCLYGGQPPQEVYTLSDDIENEICVQAPRNEVELCLQLFGLQAACKPKTSTGSYALIGGLVGLGGLVGYYCFKGIKRGMGLLGFATRAAGSSLAGAVIGQVLSIIMQKYETRKLRDEKTAEYFTPAYMGSLPGKLNHGEQVDIHSFKNGDPVLVGESLIRAWHAAAQDGSRFVCRHNKTTGELVAIVPYYGPQAFTAYEGREEIIGAPLKAPVSYTRIQELNPHYGQYGSVSIVYTHDDREDWRGCKEKGEHPREIRLSSALSRAILHGHIEIDPENNGTELQAMATY